MAIESAKIEAAIPRQLFLINEALDTLGGNIGKLGGRVEPVLRAQTPKPGTDSVSGIPGESTALGETLRAICARIASMADTVYDLQSRVEL